MNRTALAIHLAICIAVGVLGWWLVGVSWLAAAFWCSAALVFNGIVADVEDSEPNELDNPEGKGLRMSAAHAIKSFGVVLLLVGIGFAIQFWLGKTAS